MKVDFWIHGIGANKLASILRLVMVCEASGTIYSIGPAVKARILGDLIALELSFACRRFAVVKKAVAMSLKT